MEIIQEIIDSYVPGEILNLQNLSLYELPMLPEHITMLDISGNYITFIDELPANLVMLNAKGNRIESIRLPDNISVVNLTYNNLSEINLPSKVQNLSIAYNNFTVMPPLPPNIWYLDVSYNKIDTIEYLPDILKGFICIHNQLEKLPNIPIYLEYLDCSGNKLVELPTLTENLSKLICSNNQIKSIETLPKNLIIFDCEGNQFEKLPVFGKEIKFINYNNNKFKNNLKLPLKFKTFKFKPLTDIENDERTPDLLEILPDCYDIDNYRDVRSSAFLSNNDNIVFKLYGCLYGISRQKVLEYANDRKNVFRDLDSNSIYIKVIMGKYVSLIDFEKLSNPKYSIYLLSKTMELTNFQNTVKPEIYYSEKFAVHPFTLKDYITIEF
jgi:Leucine-rich repeat (LRR) protein